MNLKKFSRRLSLVCLAALLGLVGVTTAAEAGMIRAVRVEGSQRIEPETVRSYLKQDVGSSFDAESTRTSLNALYATGFFKDVAMEQEGDTLVVRVVENPMVRELTFEGNDAFSADDLKKIVTTKARAIFDRGKTERDLAALRQAYRVKGLFLAKIDLQSKSQDNNQVDLIFRISEGEKSKVQEVRIIGNKGLPEKQLMKKLLIQPTGWLSWYSEDDTYDREKLLSDQNQLRNTYLDNGYARVRVDSSVAELTPDRRAFLVTHTVHEGNRYKFGPIRIVGDFTELPEAELYKVLTTTQGEWFSQHRVRDSAEKLMDLIGDFGYAFLDIRPDKMVNDEDGVVALTYMVSKGKRVYVNRVEVSGNVRTQDNVIRREVSVVEGDRFSASKLRKAKNKLQGLNYFETIDVTTPPAGDSELVDVKIKVSEKPTGTFTLGAGYSSQESVLGMASISQNNFLGKGQRMVFSVAHSGVRNEYNISFTEPYFMNKRLSAGFDLFRRETDQTRYSSVLEKATGGAISLGFPISEHLTNTITYKLVETEVHYTGTDPSQVSQIIREQETLSPYLESIIGNTLFWDYLDNRMTPSDGRSHRLITEVAGAGGDVRFARVVTDHHLYLPIDSDKEWVGHVRARLGYEDGMGNALPIFERFFLGGSNSLRGFMPSGIGPRTEQSDAYGGSHFEQLNTELFFPMLGMSDKGVKGLVFVDAGFLGDKDLPTGVSDAGGIRVSSGVGVHWNSPFGPLRFTLGTPLIKEPNDKTRVFDFSIGSMM
ncbi:MAG: outer membrane protein assembly factor BamA [Magnetococcales bacterium]|nr:outer membrane protein assembly factor BamA [Magnetococcales bacterium]MBF0116328.1 outer membrane protein assembly factor BamA [Magnetococcales bacterium]